MVYYTEYQAHAPPLKFWQQLKRKALPRQELSEFEMLVYRNWVSDTCIANTLKTFGIVKNSWPHLNMRPIDIVKLKKSNGFCMVSPTSTWHCQVEKVKWVLYGLRRVKRKGSGEVCSEQESLAVYRISKGSCTWQKCKGTMNWNKIWNLNRNVDRTRELYWAKMGRKYKLTFANFGK